MDNEKARYYARLFWLQSAARDILFGERVGACCRIVVPGRNVQVWGDVEKKLAKYRNVIRCANIWQCPVCANNITSNRRGDVQAVITAMTEYIPVMVSFTISHQREDTLDHSLAILAEAWRGMSQCNCYGSYKRHGSVGGYVKSLEVTWGKSNGWHPHYHALFFIRGSGVIAGFYNDLRTMWAEHVDNAGGNTRWEYATTLTVADESIASYMAKWGHEPSPDNLPNLTRWGKAQEVTRGAMKTGDRGHYTPFQLLQEYLTCWEPGPAYWGKLFKTYAKAMKGQRQLVWSRKPDLRAAAGLTDEKTDSQIVEGDEAGYVLLAQLSRGEWDAILWSGERGTVLDCCARGNVGMAQQIIHEAVGEFARSKAGKLARVVDEGTGQLTRA